MQVAVAMGGEVARMKVTCEINDYSNPAKAAIRIHNAWAHSGKVELEINGERYTVVASELISAVKRATLNGYGE